MQQEDQLVLENTRRWIVSMVIGLTLCPFARRVFEQEKIRFVVTNVATPEELLQVMTAELEALASTPIETVETTLVIHPATLGDFLDYNDFLGVVDDQLVALGFEGVLQVASFHPDYQFAGTEPSAPENYSNRSPYPMLHLLREDSITALGAKPEELAAIPERNIATLNALGVDRILQRLRSRL